VGAGGGLPCWQLQQGHQQLAQQQHVSALTWLFVFDCAACGLLHNV
jgi:hypothetical protein